jgi:hypothetical protein
LYVCGIMIAASTIQRIALAYAGANITEIQTNAGFNNKPFEADMRSVGWHTGDEWCAYSAILCFKKGLDPKVWAYFQRLASGNSLQMLRNCRNDKHWPTGLTPRVGCIVVWRLGDSTTQGHVGICTSVNGSTFETCEGNTSSSAYPSIRQGWTFAKHTHSIGAPHSANSLNFVRCIYPIELDVFEGWG